MDFENEKNALIEKFNTQIAEQTKDFLTKAEGEQYKKDFAEMVKNFKPEALEMYKETIDKISNSNASLESEVKAQKTLIEGINNVIKTQGNEIAAMNAARVKEVNNPLTRKQQIALLIANAFESKEYKEFEGRGHSGQTQKMFLDYNPGTDKPELCEVANFVARRTNKSIEKAVIPVTNHTGTVSISEISNIIRDDQPMRKIHIRDFISVTSTDQLQVVGNQVYDFTDPLTLGAVMLAENTATPEVTFKSKENTWGVKRIGYKLNMSKRLFANGLKFVIDHVMSKLPDGLFDVEDFQLIRGDNAGNNLQGIADVAQSLDLTPQAYSTGDFTSIAGYDGTAQTQITFTAEHGLRNGDTLTLANTTGTTYDGDHTAVEVRNATQVIIDQAYTADANVLANWTGSSKSIFYHAVNLANEVDVLKTAAGLLESLGFEPTGHICHPSQRTQMGMLKTTTGEPLPLTKDAKDNVIAAGGAEILATTGMPAGKFITGDFTRNGCEIREFTPLNIQFIYDSSTAETNSIDIIIEEEIIFPIYNPYAFYFGKFAAAKTELETP